MKLYEVAMSPFAGRCRMVVYHKGLQDKVSFLPPFAPPASPEWRALNPLGKLPALDTGSLVLGESEVIVDYIEDRFPERSIQPKSPEDRAIARLLARICDLYVFPALSPLFGQLKAGSRDQNVVDEAVAKVGQALDNLDHFLPGDSSPYAVANQMTSADCALVNTLFYVDRMLAAFGVTDVIARRAKLGRYWQEIQNEPSAKRVLAELAYGLDQFVKGGAFVSTSQVPADV